MAIIVVWNEEVIEQETLVVLGMVVEVVAVRQKVTVVATADMALKEMFIVMVGQEETADMVVVKVAVVEAVVAGRRRR